MSDNAVANTVKGAVFIPEIWSQKLTAKLYKSGVMSKCVNRDYEGEIKDKGDTVHIQAIDDVTILTYAGSVSYEELDGDTQELIIDQSKYFAFKVQDVLKVQSNVTLMDKYINDAKKKIALVQDTFLLGKHADVPTDNIVSGDALAAITLTKDNAYSYFVELAKRLKNADVLDDGQKPWVVINPNIEANLVQAPEFIKATAKGDETTREGSIGRIAGLDILVSTNLVASSGKVYVLAGTNDAITFASQVTKVETLRDQNSFSDLVRGLYLYGAKTVQPKALAKMIIAG